MREEPLSRLSDFQQIVISFKERLQLPYDEPVLPYLLEREALWQNVQEIYFAAEVKPLFASLPPEKIESLVRRAKEQDPRYEPDDFFRYYEIGVPVGIDAREIEEILKKSELIRQVYVVRQCPDPKLYYPGADYSQKQAYLNPAPEGIDAHYAWTLPAGKGENQHFTDMERGWYVPHQDLSNKTLTLINGDNYDDSYGHGAAVLGIVAANHDGTGCNGIAPNIHQNINLSSYYNSNRPDAIMVAINNMNFGDVLLLEAQVFVDSVLPLASPIHPDTKAPIEIYDADYAVIRLATALGIIVIEAGGNGNSASAAYPRFLDLDNFEVIDPLGGPNKRILDPSSSDFRDSGAIIVTAASNQIQHPLRSRAPRGERIDCYAWGQKVMTLYVGFDSAKDDDDAYFDMYTDAFSGTSSASAIIAGAALVVQGLAEHHLGYKFGPWEMRDILSNPLYNTPSSSAGAGVMPDLRQIADNILGISSRVYIRDFVGDTGDPHTNPVSNSPDIIVRSAQVNDPQASFGEGSGTENDANLSTNVSSNTDHYLYLRCRNKGGTPATNLKGIAYWADILTFATPNLWNKIGDITLSNVPEGDFLTVSDAIVWPSANIPSAGYYTFIAHFGDQDYSQIPIPDIQTYLRLIKDNPLLTFRSINFVSAALSPGRASIQRGFSFEVPFVLNGFTGQEHPYTLEIATNLPGKASLSLEGDRKDLQRLGLLSSTLVLNSSKAPQAAVTLNANGRNAFPGIVLSGYDRISLRLSGTIPKKHKKRSFTLSVVQLWKKQEVGRITWVIQA